MSYDHLKSFIDGAFEHASEIKPDTKGVVRDGVEEVLNLLDKGELRVAEKIDGEWVFTLHRIHNEGNARTFTAGQENPVIKLDE